MDTVTQPLPVQAIAPQTQTAKATPLPYPLYRQANPYPTPAQLVYPNQEFFREQPQPGLIQYVPVYIQAAPEDQQEYRNVEIGAFQGEHRAARQACDQQDRKLRWPRRRWQPCHRNTETGGQREAEYVGQASVRQ